MCTRLGLLLHRKIAHTLMRFRISFAALFVKVTERMLSGVSPCSRRNPTLQNQTRTAGPQNQTQIVSKGRNIFFCAPLMLLLESYAVDGKGRGMQFSCHKSEVTIKASFSDTRTTLTKRSKDADSGLHLRQNMHSLSFQAQRVSILIKRLLSMSPLAPEGANPSHIRHARKNGQEEERKHTHCPIE